VGSSSLECDPEPLGCAKCRGYLSGYRWLGSVEVFLPAPFPPNFGEGPTGGKALEGECLVLSQSEESCLLWMNSFFLNADDR